MAPGSCLLGLMDTLLAETTPISHLGLTLKGNHLLWSKFVLLRVKPFSGRHIFPGKVKWKSKKLSPFQQMTENQIGVHIYFKT